MEIQSGRYRLRVDPARGTILRLAFRDANGEIDLLRPARDDDPAPEPNQTACFVTVPYFGRIVGGRFEFDGRTHRLDPTSPTSPEPIHGESWRARWTLVEARDNRLALEHVYAPRTACWPFPYTARQTFELDEDGLTLSLAARNSGATAMPCGLGVHPYFPKPPGTRVQAPTTGVWPFDPLTGPGTPAPPPSGSDFTAGQEMDALVVDNCFDVGERAARLHWPGLPAALEMTATPPFDRLQIFAPAGADFLCVEPVSHLPNALCLMSAGRSGHGIRVLEPGADLSGTVRISLRTG